MRRRSSVGGARPSTGWGFTRKASPPVSEGGPSGGGASCIEERVEAMPDSRLHFSRAATYVSISALSYTFWVLYMCRHPDAEAARTFYEQVPATVYMWPMIAFATAILLNLLSMAFERRPVKRQLCFLATFISGVAFVYEFLAWKQAAPIYITAAGRPISLLRYVMWAHATPLMLYALSMISDFTVQQVWQTVAVDIFMIVTVIPGELIPAWHRWLWNFVSCAVYPYIFHQLWQMYSAAIQEARVDGTQASLRMLRNVTVVFWSLFPLIWCLVQLDWVSVWAEEVLWCCADTAGKIFFSSTLLHSNFMSIEHRRTAAMRVVEEANRIRVIHELRALLEQKEQFIALTSHELRTPLNGIIGLSNVLLMDAESLPPETTKTVTTIRNSGARLLNLINDILDAAALRKGKLAVQQGKVNLRHVADDVLDLAAALAQPGVSARNKIGPSVPQVVGDTSRIVQVLYNLVGNACKFTERGSIWVDAAVSPARDVVSVSVHDTGIGIPEDKLEHIFAPFAQVDMSTTRRYGGTGLGLNLVQQLVEAHGGAITVASRPGKGSVFTFTLRAWQGEHEGEAGPAPLSDAQRRSMAAAARSAAAEAEEELDRVPMPEPEDEPLLGRAFGRRDSEPDMLLRLSHDAQPHNMLQRLSADSRMRSSYDADYSSYHKAPQQLSPQAAFNAFLSAGAHAVVRDIQQGRVADPHGVAAVAAEGAAARAAAAAAPRPRRHDWAAAERALEAATGAGQVKVLSVDDDPVNQMVIQSMLTRAGYRVEKAADGQKALDMLQDAVERGDPPHLVLLDVMMPGLSGYDVVRLVRRRHPGLLLPVVLVSANSREEHVVEGLQAGANDYVTKPFSQRELVARVQAQLRMQRFAQGVAQPAAREAGEEAPPPAGAAPPPPAAAAAEGPPSGAESGGGGAARQFPERQRSAPLPESVTEAAVAAESAALAAAMRPAAPAAQPPTRSPARPGGAAGGSALQQLTALAAATRRQHERQAQPRAAVQPPAPQPMANRAPRRSSSHDASGSDASGGGAEPARPPPPGESAAAPPRPCDGGACACGAGADSPCGPAASEPPPPAAEPEPPSGRPAAA